MQAIKHLLTFGALLLGTLTATAQQEWLKLSLEARVDYQHEAIDGEQNVDNSGFKGRYFNLLLSGEIGHGFSYAYRQRLNKDQSFFAATDWLYLTYTTPNNRWALSAGKQVVGVGGYEYDIAPIDCYFYSEYCSNIGCYQFGASVTHTLKSGRDSFMAQVTESPFRGEESKDMYAYNLMWMGRHEWFQTLYSLNAMECMPGEYIYYIALGNRFDLGGVVIDLDLMNRATNDQPFFFRNCSVMGQVKVDVGQYVKLLAKATYDVNHTSTVGDFCVAPGTELTRLSGAVEVYPIKGKRDVRLHAAYGYTFGSADRELNVLQDKQSMIDIGLTWRMNLVPFPWKKQ